MKLRSEEWESRGEKVETISVFWKAVKPKVLVPNLPSSGTSDVLNYTLFER